MAGAILGVGGRLPELPRFRPRELGAPTTGPTSATRSASRGNTTPTASSASTSRSRSAPRDAARQLEGQSARAPTPILAPNGQNVRPGVLAPTPAYRGRKVYPCIEPIRPNLFSVSLEGSSPIHRARLAFGRGGPGRVPRAGVAERWRGGQPASSGTADKSPNWVMRRSPADPYRKEELPPPRTGGTEKMAQRPKPELP